MSRQKQRQFCTPRQEGARDCVAWENASRGSALRAKIVPKTTAILHFTEMTRQNDNNFALCNKHAHGIVVGVRSGCQRQDALDESTILNDPPKHSARSEPTSSQKRSSLLFRNTGLGHGDRICKHDHQMSCCSVNILDNKLWKQALQTLTCPCSLPPRVSGLCKQGR